MSRPGSNAERTRGAVAGWLGVVVVAIGVLARASGGWRSGEDLVALLSASALLCLGALAFGRAPTAAWLAFVGAALIACTEAGPLAVRSREASSDPAMWLPAGLAVTTAVILAASSALLYATRPIVARGGRVLGLIIFAWMAVAFTATLVLGLTGVARDPAFTIRDLLVLPTTAARLFIAAIASIGFVADARPALARTRARVAEERPGLIGATSLLLDEVSGRAAARSEAAALERRRLAGELHAEVLPAVHAALAEVDRGAPSERLARSLRSLADDLETVVRERHDVVLEALGLVPALESLAERIEARHDVTVQLAIDSPVEAAGQPSASSNNRCPPAVATAAYTIARLAIDNAIRHGRARSIEISLIESAGRLDMAVRDNGGSIAAGAIDDAARDGRRGISDMRRAALDVGGNVSIEPSTNRGTLVRFEWPAAVRSVAAG